MKPSFATFLLTKVCGWRFDPRPIPYDKCIILGFPHTSIPDYFIFFLYMHIKGKKPNVLMKKEFFKWPLKPLLLKLGAIPVDRARGAGVLKKACDILSSRDRFILSLAPEGTRKAVKRWKMGFHTIAKSTGVPVLAGYWDWNNKYITHGNVFELTDDKEADMLRLQKFYKYDTSASGKYPGKVAYTDGI